MDAFSPIQAMAMAIEEGRKGIGFVSPNPLVGCVIVDRDHRLLACGHHAQVGFDHAEVDALKKVADPTQLDGATVYVTLEPCAHEGRTPSCAKALAKLPIRKVVYGLMDPNPKVAGQGAEILRAAGKDVELFSELHSELEELAEIFLVNIREMRPFVALKVASSLDGRIALMNGDSKWITNESSRVQVHEWRGGYDAVLTGAGTIRWDNPLLNSRDARFKDKAPKLIVLDPDGWVASHWSELQVSSVRRPEDAIAIVKKGLGRDAKIPTLELELNESGFPLDELMAQLFQRGIMSLFVEAGGITTSAFLREKAFDRLYLFLAPKILGQGLTWTEGLQLPSMDSVLQFQRPALRSFGDDLLWTARLLR